MRASTPAALIGGLQDGSPGIPLHQALDAVSAVLRIKTFKRRVYDRASFTLRTVGS
jgi:hypothetical protein